MYLTKLKQKKSNTNVRYFQIGNLFQKKQKKILEVNLSPSGLEVVDKIHSTHPLEAIFQKSNKIALYRLLYSLQQAAYDDDIASVTFIIGNPLNPSDIEELRKVIKTFRDKGKSTYIYSETYTKYDYFLASAFQNIFLLPTGIFVIPVLDHSVSIHWGKVLEK
jgi:protease-4